MRRAEQRSVGKCLPSSHRKRRGPELEPSRLGSPAPGGVRSRPILFPNRRPGEVRAREAIPQQQVFLRVQSGDVLLIAARIQKYGGDEPQAGPNKRLPEINRRSGPAGRVGPTKIPRRLKQRFAFIAMWKRPAAGSRNEHPALFWREKRRAQRHVLCPMAEMIGLRLVHHFFSEIHDGLPSTHLDLAAKSQTGDGKPNGQLQGDFLLAYARSDLSPSQARGLAVD